MDGEAIEMEERQLLKQAASLTIRLTGRGALQLARLLVQIAKWPFQRDPQTKENRRKGRRLSERELQHTADGGVKITRISPDDARRITRELKKAGIDFHVEKARGDVWYLHFEGKSIDHLQHVLERVGILDHNALAETTPDEPAADTRQIPVVEQATPDEPEPVTAEIPKTGKTEGRNAGEPEPDGKTAGQREPSKADGPDPWAEAVAADAERRAATRNEPAIDPLTGDRVNPDYPQPGWPEPEPVTAEIPKTGKTEGRNADEPEPVGKTAGQREPSKADGPDPWAETIAADAARDANRPARTAGSNGGREPEPVTAEIPRTGKTEGKTRTAVEDAKADVRKRLRGEIETRAQRKLAESKRRAPTHARNVPDINTPHRGRK
ncbi:mobilization protein [Bifidobacterium margollesii]|uniref:Mobilization protein n=1 Tax=Bifidobacterium margollesii TaxID=2020964 RepID=A0A2N5J6W5_9BIFI|nr:DUF3801 domain-containing protein [Bifidobacterium margollesii]PLS29961.1 mobilization protein [Bifidobacterium margollesii]